MLKILVKAATLIIGLAAFGPAAAGGGGLSYPTPPLILKTAVNLKQSVLIITGRHFGMTVPTVRLAEYVLRVQRFSKNEIVANLPPDIEPATYGLSVTSASRSTSGLFSVAYLPKPLEEQGAQP